MHDTRAAHRGAVVIAASLLLVGCGADRTEEIDLAAATEGSIATAPPPPAYSHRAEWPPDLPNGWEFGVVTSVYVDGDDDVWVLHRPRTATADNVAPPVVEFDSNGEFLRAWGGEGNGYDWPHTEHGIYVDEEENVWITGINPEAGNQVSDISDDMILKFTADGEFLLQLGGRDVAGGNTDTENPRRAADIAVHPATGEAFIADGYGNNRVWVVDAETGEHRRMWGAFANEPEDDPDLPEPQAEGRGPEQFDIVHGVAISNDGLVYVSDRTFRRIQVFTVEGEYVRQGFVARDQEPRPTVSRVSFSADPDQRYIFASDFGGGIVWILDRATMATIGSFGQRGTAMGEFGNLHHIATDSQNNVYTAEVGVVGRLQKWGPGE